MQYMTRGTVGEQENGVTLVFDSQIRATRDKRTRNTNVRTTTVGGEQRTAVRQCGGTGNVT